MIKPLALLGSSIIGAALLAQSSPVPQDPGWVQNAKDAPLLIISQGNALILKNRTDKLIESYRLACISAQTNHVTVLHRFGLQHTPIPPLGDATYAAFDGPPQEQVACQNLRAKLSVLQVNFKDGATWQPPGNSSQHSKSKIDNTHGAPLVIVGKQHTLTVQNRSVKTVQSYQLGCVRKNRSSIVVHRFPLEKATIAPSTGAMSATFDAPPEEQVRCHKLRARVSVLEATFNDGTKWHLPNDSSQSSHNLAKKKSQAALK